MDIVDMPSDPNGYLGHFRSTLRGTYNSNRSNSNAIALIKATLEYAVGVLQSAEAAPDTVLALPAPAPEKPKPKGKTSEKPKAKAKGKTKKAAKR